MPNRHEGLGDLQQVLSSKLLNKIDSQLKLTRIDVHIPKFKFEFSPNLKHILQKLGIKKLFNDQADLSGISNDEGLQVSDVIHRAEVEVNEEGTQASAATGKKLF